MRILSVFIALIFAASLSHLPVAADELAVPVMMEADGDLDTCSLGKVVGLNPKGDNFLAVRAGPGTNFKMLDKIHTNDQVWMFSESKNWVGIVYGSQDINCSPIKTDKPYSGPGKKGWVHKKFITVLAG